ncbi:MAG TPA: hypothetical protein VHB25_06475 [Gemmatimonadaceae bacterium]|nr:hypothetical protein [Gemmatimonadaceae bacterium]
MVRAHAAAQRLNVTNLGAAIVSEIRVRWEWRAFDPPHKAARDALARADEPPGPPVTSDEVYVLSRLSPHNVKIRGGQLDVKMLEATRASGLELWRPTLKARFPVTPAELAPVWHAWAITPPHRLAESYTLDRLLREIVDAIPTLLAISVVKHRTRLTLAGCAGEHARIEIAGRELTTIAFEDEDPERVLHTVHAAGLDALPTSSYPAALKAVLGLARPLTPSPRVSV